MTDEQNATDQNISDAVTQTSSEIKPAVADQSQEKTEVAEEEKTLKQSQVNELVGITRKEAYERGKKEAEAVLKAAPVDTTEGFSTEAAPPAQMSSEQVQQMIKQEAANQANQAQAQKIVDELSQKVIAARDKYPDVDEKLGTLHLDYYPHIAGWANTLPNTVDVLYEMQKNPAKYGQVISLVNSGMPELAFAELQKLSKSIQQNDKGKEQQFPAEPLGQVKPTITGADNGSLTVEDIKNMPTMKA